MAQATQPIEAASPPADEQQSTSMMIDGKLYERMHTRSCKFCSRPVGFFVVRALEGASTIRSRVLGEMTIDGRHVEWTSPDLCSSCRAMALLMEERPGFRTRRLDRGIHRAAVVRTIEWLASKGTAMAQLEGEVLSEILESNKENWISTAVFRSHRYSTQVEPIVVNLIGETTGPEAELRLGRVEIEVVDPLIPLRSPRVDQLLDRHAGLDFGEHGLAGSDEVSPAARWCPCLALVREQNRMTLEAKEGPLRGLHTQPDLLANRLRWSVEICTFLVGGKGDHTLVLGRKIQNWC